MKRLAVRQLPPRVCRICGDPATHVITYWDLDRPGPYLPVHGKDVPGPLIAEMSCDRHITGVAAYVDFKQGRI